MLEIRSSTFTLSLTEIPIAIGILGVQRLPLLISATLGWLAALLLSRRRSPLKLALNVPIVFVEIAVAASVFDLVVTTPDLGAWTSWLALLAGLTVAGLISTSVVNVVISVAGDPMPVRDALRHTVLALANVVLATALSVVALLVLSETVAAIVPLVILGAVSVIPLRQYAKLHRRHDGLLLLHQFTAGLTSSTDLGSTLDSVVAESAKVLRTGRAMIVLPRPGETLRQALPGADAATLVETGDVVWESVFDRGAPILLAHHGGTPDPYLAQHGIRDLMAVPLVHGDEVIGALVVADRLGETSTFDDDLAIFTTMANQTTVTLRNLRLIDQLRVESSERRRQALHDDLTGLPNRAHLAAWLDQHLDGGTTAVAVLDLNRFKEVNDTLGHHVGDEVLLQTAERLRAALPSSAFVARMGGDEFAIVLPGIDGPAAAVARLARLEATFARPIDVEAMALRIDASIGVAVSPEHGSEGTALLRHADVAMYAAKQVGGTAVRLYDRTQERSSKRSLEIVTELRRAVEENLLEVVYQPKGCLRTRSVVGAEALARWTHPTLGVIRPDEFIPIAEQAGMVGAITTYVLRRSLESCAAWHRSGLAMGVAVNIDARTLLDPAFRAIVGVELAGHGMSPAILTFEITEREIVREADVAVEAIEDLRRIGVRFSIDDFGTGFSSLGYLTRLPVDELKIDRSFIVDLVGSPKRESIVRAIADMAHSLGLTTVVEGIEDEATWATVTALGCDSAQGYHFARPIAASELQEWALALASCAPS
jgi:diguanylate cyclase (GGDEF)-like protein